MRSLSDAAVVRGWRVRKWPMIQCPGRFRWIWDLAYVLHGFRRPLLWVPPKGVVQRTQVQAWRMIKKKRLHRQIRTALRWSRRHRKPLFERIKVEISNELAKLAWQVLGAWARKQKKES